MSKAELNTSAELLVDEVGDKLGQAVLEQGEKGYGLFHRHRYILLAEKFLEFKTQEPQNFLEIGSYNCFVPVLAQTIGYTAYGLDLPIFIKQFEETELKFNLTIKPCDLSGEPIPFEDNWFDLINFSEVLEHFNFYPAKALVEFLRVLKSGGHLLITTPNQARFNNRLKLLLGLSINWDIKEPFSPMTHAREYTAKEVVWLLKLAGFTKISVGYAHIDYPDINIWLRRFNRFIGKICPVLASNLIITAEK